MCGSHGWLRTMCFVVSIVAVASVAKAQTLPLPTPRNAPQPASSSDLRMVPVQNRGAAAGTVNDPTLPSPEIRSLLEGDKTPEAATPANPTIRLRARVIAKGKPGLAIIAVGESLFTMREGDEVTLGGATPVRLVKLSALDVQVEVGARKQLLNLN